MLKYITIDLIDLPKWDVRYARNPEWEDYFVEMIRRQGIWEPLHVLRKGNRYLLLEGRTRFMAARRVGLMEVPCIVHDSLDMSPKRYAFHLNMLKRGLGVVSVASMAWELVYVENMKYDEVARELGISRGHLFRLLKLLRRNPKELREIELGLRHAWPRRRRQGDRLIGETQREERASLLLRCVICGSEGQAGLGKVFFLCREHVDAGKEFERAVIRYSGRLEREIRERGEKR